MTDPEPFDPIDDAIARQLAEVHVDVGLRDGIVNGFRRRQRRQMLVTMAGAAVLVVALLLGGSLMWRDAAPTRVAAQDWEEQAVRFIESDFNLARFQPDNEELQRFYSGIEPGETLRLPDQLAAKRPVGCREVELDGVKALLVCYYFASGDQMHLFVTRPESFREELANKPSFTTKGEWQTAAWTRNGFAYVAVASGERNWLLELLAIRTLDRPGILAG